MKTAYTIEAAALAVLTACALFFLLYLTGLRGLPLMFIPVFAAYAVFTLWRRDRARRGAEKQKAEREANKKRTMDDETLEYAVDRLRTLTARPAFRITTQKAEHLPLTTSKFGGLPYWDPGVPYPVDPFGKPLTLLAQIRLDDLPKESPLPDTGLLQFFVLADTTYGCDFRMAKQTKFRVVLHDAVNEDITEAEVLAAGILPNTALDPDTGYMPFYGEYALAFTPFDDAIGMDDAAFPGAVKASLDHILPDGTANITSDEYETMFNGLNTFGHKLLGWPAFTQSDPRDPSADAEGCTTAHYNTLLLQIDSLDGIMWGDSGVANFFISSKALAEHDFSDILYNWDCH